MKNMISVVIKQQTSGSKTRHKRNKDQNCFINCDEKIKCKIALRSINEIVALKNTERSEKNSFFTYTSTIPNNSKQL